MWILYNQEKNIGLLIGFHLYKAKLSNNVNQLQKYIGNFLSL